MTDAKLLELAESQAAICGVFGNAKRLLILWTLGKREMSVSEIASAIDCSLQNTSQHLRLMKDKDILASRREGHTMYYRIKPNEVVEGCRLLLQARQGLFIQERPVEST
jgi:DNA-binding transcriptional ArsR family regulator